MSDAVKDYLATFVRPVIPAFETKAVKMEFASKEAGRPIYEDREFVTILVVGERSFSAYEPVSDEHKERWPTEYAAFKAGKELPVEGTPLSEWPSSHINRSRVEELAFFNIRTVEQMAIVNDGQLQRLGMGARELREAAKKFLEVARTGTGPLERMLAENFTLKDENERLTRELTEANARAAAAEKKERANASA